MRNNINNIDLIDLTSDRSDRSDSELRLINPIKKGAFGRLYKAYDYENNEEYAVKVEKNNKKYSLLSTEYKFGKYIQEQCSKYQIQSIIPTIKNYIQTSNYNILIMQKLNKDLESYVNTKNKKNNIPIHHHMILFREIIKLLKNLHKFGIIHRDIKPSNLMFDDNKVLYLIDLGLSDYYVNKKTWTHKPDIQVKNYVGTPKFMSINAHKCTQLSRRDDLISTYYMIIYMILGYLPWENIPRPKYKPNKKYNKKQHKHNLRKAICHTKEYYTWDKLCDLIDSHITNKQHDTSAYIKYVNQLRQIGKIIFSLKHNQIPPYRKIGNILINR